MKNTQEKLLLEQIALQEKVQRLSDITIVTCGNCSTTLLHNIGDGEIQCHDCMRILDLCDCPDLYYFGQMPKQPNETDVNSLDRQYFWIERPKAVIAELKKHFDKVDDVSYINDSVPSLLINELYTVFLPNAIQDSETGSSTYAIIRDEDLQEGKTECMQYVHTIDRVVELVEEMVEEDLQAKIRAIHVEFDYDVYLFACLLKLYDESFNQAAYDWQFDMLPKLYKMFMLSPENNQINSAYDCMIKYLDNRYLLKNKQ
jgi:hypothetical protein